MPHLFSTGPHQNSQAASPYPNRVTPPQIRLPPTLPLLPVPLPPLGLPPFSGHLQIPCPTTASFPATAAFLRATDQTLARSDWPSVGSLFQRACPRSESLRCPLHWRQVPQLGPQCSARDRQPNGSTRRSPRPRTLQLRRSADRSTGSLLMPNCELS